MHSRCFSLVFLFTSVSLLAQLIPPKTPVPRTGKPPVVFLNGHQNDCTSSSFASTFGIADQVLAANGEVSLFFDNCTVPDKPPIETLGAAFGDFLANLKFTDGRPVDTVDVVAHSMGGLIVRSYLSGKQTASGSFRPPAVIRIRKAVFLATPHFGSGVATLGFGLDAQVDELASGSRFLYDLATWNQGTDDLRGVDSVTAIGNGGTGLATRPGFDDGVVALTSASLGFYMQGRTRVVPFCHVSGGGLVSLAGFCASNARGIAKIQAATDDSARIIVSFLNGTTEWQTVGTAPEQDPLLSVNGGLNVTARTASDAPLKIDSVSADASRQNKKLNIVSNSIAYTDMFLAGPMTLTAMAGSVTVSESQNLPAGFVQAVLLKPGPESARVLPAASSVFPLSVAPREIVSIYGTSLAAGAAQASSVPLPTQLSDAQVLLSGTAVPLFYASPNQINAVIPETASGLVKLTVMNAAGSHTVNVLVETAVPSIFTQDASGKGAAAALNARDSSLVTASSPLRAGDFVELFLTGLGTTNQAATVTIAGKDCPVSFAGRAPGFVGLDQINCQVPAGLTADRAAPIVVTSGNRVSNAATIAIQ